MLEKKLHLLLADIIAVILLAVVVIGSICTYGTSKSEQITAEIKRAQVDIKSLPESFYRDYVALHFKGEIEYYIRGKRIDVVTDEYAIEVERAYKWREGIGQSLDYGFLTGKTPCIVLIVIDEKDENYLEQLLNVVRYWKLKIVVFTINNIPEIIRMNK